MITTFGTWIQMRRRSLQLSQEQLSKSINYSTITIRKLESGSRRCSEDLAVLLANVLDVPAELLPAFLHSARTGIVDPALQRLKLSDLPDPDDAGADLHLPPHPLTRFAEPTTPLFGREVDIAQVLGMLQQPFTRLITLLGPPGVGKSCLATAVLQQAESADWPDGTFFVPLVTINHATLIPQAIAAAMGIQEVNARKWLDTVPSQNIFRFIKDKRALLVLDNFEHLPEGIAFLNELLKAAPLVKVIVTSQMSLQVSNEQVYPVHSLPVPDAPAFISSKSSMSLSELAQNAAVGLFISRAQSRRPGFKLTDENANAVVELCRKLGGLPLALELAAVRLKSQSPQELLAQFQVLPQADQIPRIPQSTALQWLSRKVTNVPQRHQTLFAALTWSYNLLTPEAQIMFDQLGVFQSGFTREAALAMTHGSLESLELLAGHSLLQVQVTPDDDIRLNLLEIFREFALMKLRAKGAIEETCRRHACYFIDQFKDLDAGLHGPDHLDWLAMMDIETPNARAALQWCVDDDPAAGFVLARNLMYFWFIAGYHHEGRAWVSQLMGAGEHNSDVSSRSRAELLCHAVLLHFETTASVLEEQLALFQKLGDAAGIVLAQTMLGYTLIGNKPAEAERHLVQVIAVLDTQRDTWPLTLARVFLAICLHAKGDFVASEKLLNENIQLLTRLQDTRSLARIQNHLGWLAFVQGDFAKAWVVASHALPLNQHFKDTYGMLEALSNMSFAAVELGDLTQAKACIDEGMRLVRETGVDAYQPPFLHIAGALAFVQGNIKDACQLYLQSIAFAQQQFQTDHIRTNMINIAQVSICNAAGDAALDMAPIVEWLSAVQNDGRQAGYHFPISYQKRMDQTLTIANKRLGPAAMEVAKAKGIAMSWDTAIMLAQSAAETIIIGILPKSRTDVHHVDHPAPNAAPFPAG